MPLLFQRSILWPRAKGFEHGETLEIASAKSAAAGSHARAASAGRDLLGYEKAFADCEPEAADYEAIVAAYALDGCVADLWDGLQQLSTFDNDEIEWHLANPGKRMEQAYISG